MQQIKMAQTAIQKKRKEKKTKALIYKSLRMRTCRRVGDTQHVCKCGVCVCVHAHVMNRNALAIRFDVKIKSRFALAHQSHQQDNMAIDWNVCNRNCNVSKRARGKPFEIITNLRMRLAFRWIYWQTKIIVTTTALHPRYVRIDFCSEQRLPLQRDMLNDSHSQN